MDAGIQTLDSFSNEYYKNYVALDWQDDLVS